MNKSIQQNSQSLHQGEDNALAQERDTRIKTHIDTDRETDRQKDKQIDRQTERQTETIQIGLF